MKRIVLAFLAALIGVVLGLAVLAALLKHRQAATLSQPPPHGMSFMFEADLSATPGDTNALANLKEAIRKRFDKLGVRIFWEPVSNTRFRVVAAIENDETVELAKSFITRRGLLEFRLVHGESGKLVERGEVPADHELLRFQELLRSGDQRTVSLLVKRKSELAGSVIQNAMVMRGSQGEPRIAFELNAAGTEAFARITRENVGRQLAILLDGELYAAPVIRSPIEAGNGEISGRFDKSEAFKLATLLECPLPVPTTLQESRSF